MTMFIDMTLIFFKETGTFYYFLPFLQNIYTFLTAEDRKKCPVLSAALTQGWKCPVSDCHSWPVCIV